MAAVQKVILSAMCIKPIKAVTSLLVNIKYMKPTPYTLKNHQEAMSYLTQYSLSKAIL